MLTNSYFNLKEYIEEDEIYQQYLKKDNKEDFSDFDLFCIQHCEDIENYLDLCDILDKNLTIQTQKLLDIKTYCKNHKEIMPQNAKIFDDILNIINKEGDSSE